MYLLRTALMAGRALLRNRMRSILMTLAICMGVAVVIAIVEISQGASVTLKETIASMGANMLMVQPGAAASGGASFGGGSAMTLTPGDADALADPQRVPALVSVAPQVRARTQLVNPETGKNWVPNQLTGTTPEFLDVRRWNDLTEGDPFTSQDVAGQREVCLIGQTIARELYPNGSPVGKRIRINNKPFTIVGVLSRKGANMFGQDQDDIVLTPWTTLKFKVAGQSATTTNQSATAKTTDPTQQTNSLNQFYPNQDTSFLYTTQSATQTADAPLPVHFINVDSIMVEAASAEEIPTAIAQINDVLRERHHIKPGQADDFNVRDMTEFSSAMSKQSETMGWLLFQVAACTLVVGGVGIMCIMLVSVTERTREIGLRMAVGARSRDIMCQFLVESALLCLIGGICGILMGRGASFLIWWFAGWPVQPSLTAILGAVAASVMVGLIFGFYPAMKASRLDPIEALRYE
jgi:ABC-type antimicrobial peptide transport system permease subunit